jgi:hypothetical protein
MYQGVATRATRTGGWRRVGRYALLRVDVIVQQVRRSPTLRSFSLSQERPERTREDCHAAQTICQLDARKPQLSLMTSCDQ